VANITNTGVNIVANAAGNSGNTSIAFNKCQFIIDTTAYQNFLKGFYSYKIKREGTIIFYSSNAAAVKIVGFNICKSRLLPYSSRCYIAGQFIYTG
jgi:hypothetical protein